MIPVITKYDLITPLTQIKSVTPVTAIADTHLPAEFELGQKYQAIVEARLPNGNSRVLVADKLLQMNLPEKFQPGHKLELVFISPESDPKFLLLDEASTETQEKNTTLSITGRFLGLLMQEGAKHALANTLQSLTSPVPIVKGASINSAELPVLLQKAITQSGLFYESHQAQWLNGENTLENLQREPQNKLMSTMADMPAARTIGSSSLNPEMPLNVQSIPMVMQQLATLETNHLFWQGEIWKNQHMEWDIHERSEDDKHTELEPSQWQTQLRLSMPQLGEVTAKIALNSQGIQIRVDAS
ncbi:MAG: flagellar hook-length control protein FliK, partial [Nitrosomonas sp.]|nr:flagellar hook-length control protein FliK [Nitrosomonas sp.]